MLLKFSGVPNVHGLPIPDGLNGFSCVCWNGRAIYHHDPAIRKQKASQVAHFCKKFDIVALLEVHGSPNKVKQALKVALRTHVLFCSQFIDSQGDPRSDTGGVCLLVSKGLAKNQDSSPVANPDFASGVAFHKLIPGRAVKLEVFGPKEGQSFIVYIVHNHDLSPAEMSLLEDNLRVDSNRSRANPTLEAVLLMGDFNISAPGDKPIKLDAPVAPWAVTDPGTTSAMRYRPMQQRWQSIFDSLTEIKCALPSHVNIADLSLNRIDRVFSSLPRSSLLLLSHQTGVLKDPTYWYSKRWSDHAPNFWSVSVRSTVGAGEQRLKPEWCNSCAFQNKFSALCEKAALDKMCVPERSIAIKEFMSEAAIYARDVLFSTEPESLHNVLIRLSSISRCVWMNDVDLSMILLEHSDLAREHLIINPSGHPSLIDPLKFEEAFRIAKADHLACQRNQILRDHPNRGDVEGSVGTGLASEKRKNKLQANNRGASLWTPLALKFIIAGSLLSHEEALSMGLAADGDDEPYRTKDGNEHFTALQNVWGPTFRGHDVDAEEIDEFLIEYKAEVDWPWHIAVPPGSQTVKAVVSSLKPTAPGRDGKPNKAWQQSGQHGIDYLVALLDAHLAKTERPADINEGLFLFPRKASSSNTDAQSGQVVFCHPTELRPLTLKNGDNKIIAGCANRSISPVIAKAACHIQRGFIFERQLLQNVVDLDFSCRESSLDFNARNPYWKFTEDLSLVRKGIVGMLPVLLLFDFAAAFPSVSHKWLRAVLVACKIPLGILNLFDCLYTGNEGYCSVSGGEVRWIFSVLCGVLQGCPLSGSLFVIAIDPLLYQFHKKLCAPTLATVRACADDIGAVLKQLRNLVMLWKLFESFRKVSLLTLKPRKCILIPLTVDSSERNCIALKDWLREFIPEWAHFNIVSASKYLGIYLGPQAGAKQWIAPLAKFKNRVSEIHAQHLPAQLAVNSFMSKGVSVLGYVSQIVPPPRLFKSVELASALKVMGLATNSFSTETVYNLEFWGWSKITRPSVYMRSCMIRAACRTLVNYEVMHNYLVKVALEGLCLNSAVMGETIPPGWDSEAFCTNLVNCCKGLIGNLPAPKVNELKRWIKDYKKGRISTQGSVHLPHENKAFSIKMLCFCCRGVHDQQAQAPQKMGVRLAFTNSSSLVSQTPGLLFFLVR